MVLEFLKLLSFHSLQAWSAMTTAHAPPTHPDAATTQVEGFNLPHTFSPTASMVEERESLEHPTAEQKTIMSAAKLYAVKVHE